MTRLVTMVLGVPLASVAINGGRVYRGSGLSRGDFGGQQNLLEQTWYRRVIDSQDRLIIDDAAPDRHGGGGGGGGRAPEPATVMAWAGFPVRDPAGHVVGALCAADHLPHRWTAAEVEVLEILAQIASREVALKVALQHGAERAELAQTLQESLLPPRLPEVPGLEVAARYRAGGTGAEVLGDFFDVFPSMRRSWGMVVGDVCGKGVAAAKSTAVARYTLRAEAHRQTRPSLILAALNQALLDWPTADPRFLSAIYATVWPTAAGASVQISMGGHPLALIHRADGRVQTFGVPGTLLGLFPDPELLDSRRLLRAGDSLIMYTDGVTEARGAAHRDLYGEDRLRGLLAGLGQASAARIGDAIQHAVLAFSGGVPSDDTVVLVIKVPRDGSDRLPPAQTGQLVQRNGDRLKRLTAAAVSRTVSHISAGENRIISTVFKAWSVVRQKTMSAEGCWRTRTFGTESPLRSCSSCCVWKGISRGLNCARGLPPDFLYAVGGSA
ncbi:MAG TPA: GAF domain-containing SpoIIE family protein phosphatase [Streptosporangiaceae bacterium]|nr:GAF domain-containing SpoIIE family protein phosphatase [Streptosporangiaceae bacterium]